LFVEKIKDSGKVVLFFEKNSGKVVFVEKFQIVCTCFREKSPGKLVLFEAKRIK
jgi:hypothetical protein